MKSDIEQKIKASHYSINSQIGNVSINIFRSELKTSKEAILRMLGLLANDLLSCWESSAMNVKSATYGSQHSPLSSKDIFLDNYVYVKQELIKHMTISLKLWSSLDKLHRDISDLNEINKTERREDSIIHNYHFANRCKSLWEMITQIYKLNGGREKELNQPMFTKLPKGYKYYI